MELREGAIIAAELKHMSYKFYHDRVMVLMDPPETKAGSLFLPNGASIRRYSGTIVAVGVGEGVRAAGVEVVDRIIVNRWNPTEINITRLNGDEITLIAFHTYDLYVGWTDVELRLIYDAELARLNT